MDGVFCGLRPVELAMARDLKRWVAAALAACGVIGIAYLPPRGGVRPNRALVFPIPELTPARRRAQALAAEWRAVNGAARLLEQRRRLRSALSHSGDHVWGPTILLTGVDSIPPNAMPLVSVAMDSVWANLGLADTKVRVHVVIELLPTARGASTSVPTQGGEVYLEPDSTDRTICVALVPAGRYWTRFILGERTPGHASVPSRFVQWLSAGLGPCAFYAAYGTPGRPVRRWLAARKWNIALYLGSHGIAGERFSSVDLMGDPRSDWYWRSVYSFPSATVACLAGRTAGCRAAVLDGADAEVEDAIPRVVRLEQRWWRTQRLLPGERFLSDVARAVGRDRFLRFWGSPLPVDTALATALKMPVGDWTAQWQRGYVRQLRLGAAAPLGASLLSLVLGAIAVISVALTVSRRQVR
jgi:hypothetical protein